MSLPAFRGTARALPALPRWAAAATAVRRVPSTARWTQSSASLEGQQSVRHVPATSDDARRPDAAAAAAAANPASPHTDDAIKILSSHLKTADPIIYEVIEKEKKRQKHFVNLIPSENFTSQAVLDALGSPMQSEP